MANVSSVHDSNPSLLAQQLSASNRAQRRTTTEKLIGIASTGGPEIASRASHALAEIIEDNDDVFYFVVSQLARERLNWVWTDIQRLVTPERLDDRLRRLHELACTRLGVPRGNTAVIDLERFPGLRAMPHSTDIEDFTWTLPADVLIPAGTLEIMSRAADGGLSLEFYRETVDFQAYSLSGVGLHRTAGYHLLAQWSETKTPMGACDMAVWLRAVS